ncbi:uncharacterized protein [Periplaneta americana]|uniref:uncharacterized protein n=1 Tax=Periplaneta americana TaxID=6978 RepID=UPI0037E74B65
MEVQVERKMVEPKGLQIGRKTTSRWDEEWCAPNSATCRHRGLRHAEFDACSLPESNCIQLKMSPRSPLPIFSTSTQENLTSPQNVNCTLKFKAVLEDMVSNCQHITLAIPHLSTAFQNAASVLPLTDKHCFYLAAISFKLGTCTLDLMSSLVALNDGFKNGEFLLEDAQSTITMVTSVVDRIVDFIRELASECCNMQNNYSNCASPNHSPRNKPYRNVILSQIRTAFEILNTIIQKLEGAQKELRDVADLLDLQDISGITSNSDLSILLGPQIQTCNEVSSPRDQERACHESQSSPRSISRSSILKQTFITVRKQISTVKSKFKKILR